MLSAEVAMLFADRVDAGRRLAGRLEHLREQHPIVLGLPRGGVPVAHEVALALDAPLDVVVVRKLGAPFNSEFAMGAIGEGVRVIDQDTVRSLGISARQLASVEEREQAELDRRTEHFHRGRPPLRLSEHTAIIIDDGVATGSTALAACRVVRALGAARIVLAVPVAPPGWTAGFGDAADEYVSLETPERFFGVGQWYSDFTQTTDEEVLRLLEEAPH